jgi:predicted transcriptional regulator
MTVIERLASNPNVDIDKIRQLLEMQERWEMNRDKAALRHALAQFKANPPEIIKERKASLEKDGRKLFEYMYADLENVTSAIESELGALGVTFAWPQVEKDGLITITCVMRFGMFEEAGVTMSAPPDTSGAKNVIQAKASTVTYLRRYTLLGAVGMAAGMPDSDGNLKQGIADELRQKHVKAIESSATHDALKAAFQTAVKVADQDKDALRVFSDAKNRRYKEIASGQAH